jgi:LacI family transcriptional regulator
MPLQYIPSTIIIGSRRNPQKSICASSDQKETKMKLPDVLKIGVLINCSSLYGRGVITGVANFFNSTRIAWRPIVSTDFYTAPEDLADWDCDGWIVDFDNPLISPLLTNLKMPVVAIGSSAPPPNFHLSVPRVGTDNFAVVAAAYEHLVVSGLTRFAFFSEPPDPWNAWAMERENAFRDLMQKDGFPVEIYRGQRGGEQAFENATHDLEAWLLGLPKPIGIIATNDNRGKELLQACARAKIAVPEKVAVIGIDDDPVVRAINRVPLSSVIPAFDQIGYQAAQLLHQMFAGKQATGRFLLPPIGINAETSSRHQVHKDEKVMRARHFIRQYACQGIKALQVVSYVGVSRTSLEAAFQHELGHSIHTEILLFKLHEAMACLARGEESIKDIATRCGFVSSQYLHTVFQRELGCSPRRYQERILKEQRDLSSSPSSDTDVHP